MVSADGRWLAASVVSGRVCVWPLAAGGASVEAEDCRPVAVPAVEGGVTALRFKPPAAEAGGVLGGRGGQGKRAGGCEALVLVSATNQVRGDRMYQKMRAVRHARCGALVLVSATNQVAGRVGAGTLGVLSRLQCRTRCDTRVSHTRLGVLVIACTLGVL